SRFASGAIRKSYAKKKSCSKARGSAGSSLQLDYGDKVHQFVDVGGKEVRVRGNLLRCNEPDSRQDSGRPAEDIQEGHRQCQTTSRGEISKGRRLDLSGSNRSGSEVSR